jgi:hypothetical protein
VSTVKLPFGTPAGADALLGTGVFFEAVDVAELLPFLVAALEDVVARWGARSAGVSGFADLFCVGPLEFCPTNLSVAIT